MPVRNSWLVACAGLVFAAAVSADPEQINYLDPPQGRFLDDWMVVEFGGNKVGYSHNTISRDADRITTRLLTHVKIGRADQTIEISMLQSTSETVGGEPLTFESDTKLSAIKMATRGSIRDGKVHLTTTQFGKDSRQTFDFPKGAKMSWGMFRLGIEKGFKPGTEYEFDVYEPGLKTDGAIRAKVVVGEPTSIDLPGRRVEAIQVNTTMTLPMGSYDSVGYVDSRGQVIRAVVQLAGLGEMTLSVVDKATALADFEPPEFFMGTLVKVDRSIDRQTVDRIEYTLTMTGEDRTLPELPVTGMQTPHRLSDRTVKLTVRRQDHSALGESEPRTADPALSEFLKASPQLDIHDKAVIEMARTAAGDETHPYRVAAKLRRYVSDVIHEKNLNIGFASASEVCRIREGDCTEHSVLLAALGRARGIPSRVVVGLAYVPSFKGTRDVFGFHMWTQFHIAGQWVDFDAALGETDCSPARIALGTSSLNNAAIGDLAFAIIDFLGGLKIELEEVEGR